MPSFVAFVPETFILQGVWVGALTSKLFAMRAAILFLFAIIIIFYFVGGFSFVISSLFYSFIFICCIFYTIIFIIVSLL
jgi:hypothetical protein